MQPGGDFNLPIPGDWNTIIFAYDGVIHYNDKLQVDKDHCCVL